MLKRISDFMKRLVHKVSEAAELILPSQIRFPTLMKTYLPWIMKHPGFIPTFGRLIKSYAQSSRIRKLELKRGLKAPPVLIISITSKCNLQCVGCYAAATGTVCKPAAKRSLDIEQWRKIIQEAKELGVFGFVIAGGEPFLMHDLLKLSEEFKDRLFIIFTNGTLLRDQEFRRLKRVRNTVVVVSIEGDQEMTNTRRGSGVYKSAINTIQKLSSNGIISGISATITRKNLSYWLDEKNIDDLIAKGIHLGFLLEYIPVENDTKLMLTEKENKEFRRAVLNYRETKQIFLIHSPGDEEYMGGCVSAGRGFAHVTPSGDLTPCPVSNIATHNLTRSSLREALKSPLFKVIRENEHLLETEGVPCALFTHPEEVEVLAKEVCAYKTSGDSWYS
ncbi:MAG: radical SAM protein [Candidatus Helarchaeota archaeon]|nr:radical SAM protein [Candidatus Helarchaeota archaeon]